MEKKEFFLKDMDIISKELTTKIEKAELQAVKRKQEIDEDIAELKNEKAGFDADLEVLKTVTEDKFEAEMIAFKKKHNTDSIIDELDEKLTEFAEKTKSFFTGLGNKVSDFYNKQVNKNDEPEKI
jgi:hypothetical protein